MASITNSQFRFFLFLVFGTVASVSCRNLQTTDSISSSDDGSLVITTVGTTENPSEVGDDEEAESTPVPLRDDLDLGTPEIGLYDSPSEIEFKKGNKGLLKPEIRSFRIQSNIRYRYSRTYITSRVANPNKNDSHEVTFTIVLPETAFISKFIMEIDGKAYEAYVKEKQEAKNIYNQAQSQGQSAGLVEVNTRNSNIFNVNVNVKAQSKVNFNLTYEELLSRRLGRYEQSINISPEQVSNVQDFQVTVSIEESQNITLLRVPELRNDVDALEDPEGNIKDAVIEKNGTEAKVTWRPGTKELASLSKQGITGKFVVQYDIQRELDAGQVLVMNGYFVHFFAPANLPPLRKHVVFILDISGSMWGRKIEQLKEAMTKILADLNSDDFFNIITFSSDVNLWGPEDKVQQDPTNSWASPPYLGENSLASILNDASKKQPFAATPENIKKAQNYINALVASGGTNIHDAIVTALNLTSTIKAARTAVSNAAQITTTPAAVTTVPTTEKNNQSSNSTSVTVLPNGVESLIIFLTDGEPTVGVTNPTQIQTLIQAANKNLSVPLFSLAFGEGADFPFVRKLSLQNNGFARKIYEASDATLQLTGFYSEIASPLLSNVTFNYTSPEYDVSNLTLTKFPTIFGGTEIAVSGILIPKPGNTTNESNSTGIADDAIFDVDVTTGIPRLEDSIALPENSDAPSPLGLVRTDAYDISVSVSGIGREGSLEFTEPEIFSCVIPWGVPPVIRPFPPRPTPPPSVEDTFMEKLWAYLTIRQLIDQDLAAIEKENEISDNKNNYDLVAPEDAGLTTSSTPSSASNDGALNASSTAAPSVGNRTVIGNGTVAKETPRKRALRLALKYGFVTPLTSLVVVKPNDTEVANAVPSDAKPELADSMSSQPQAMAHFAARPVLFKTSPVKKIAVTSNRITGGNYAFMPLSLQAQRPVAALVAPQSSPTSFFGGVQPGGPLGFPGPPGSFVFHPVSTTAATVATTKKPLTLQDIKWFSENATEIKVNTTSAYKIAVNELDSDLSSFEKGTACEVGSTKQEGTCQHLRDCVQSDFLNDFELYKTSYFCGIQSSTSNEVPYAGVCCPGRVV